jgi:hypothetical protein
VTRCAIDDGGSDDLGGRGQGRPRSNTSDITKMFGIVWVVGQTLTEDVRGPRHSQYDRLHRLRTQACEGVYLDSVPYVIENVTSVPDLDRAIAIQFNSGFLTWLKYKLQRPRPVDGAYTSDSAWSAVNPATLGVDRAQQDPP